MRLKEAKRFWTIAHQKVLGLLIMIEHHLMGLAPNARLLVAAERGMRRIEVIAVSPHPSSLNSPAKAVGAVAIARPKASAKPIKRIVGDRKGVFLAIKRCHR